MTQTPDLTPDVEATVKRVQELSERVIEVSKANGQIWLDAYEKVLESVLNLEQEAAGGSQLEWVNTLATTHADFVRAMSTAYLGSMRQQSS